MTPSDLELNRRVSGTPEAWQTNVEVKRVIIGTPCYGGQCTARFTRSMWALGRLLEQRGITSNWITTEKESLIGRARDSITQGFLDFKDASHLMWIDADIEFEASDVVRLLCSDFAVVGGIYPKKKLPLEPVLLLNPQDNPRDPITGNMQVKTIGTGFLCTKREVYELLAPHVHEYSISVDDEVKTWRNYWATPVEEGILWSEDYFFCRLWEKLGGKAWADPTINLNHIGTYVYGQHP